MLLKGSWYSESVGLLAMQSNACRGVSQRGFTLIEVLLALTLFALLAVTAALMLDQTTRQAQLQRERAGEEQNLHLFWQLLQRDLSQTVWRARKESFGSALQSDFLNGAEHTLSWFSAGQLEWSGEHLRPRLQRVVWRLHDGAIERASSSVLDPAVEDALEFGALLQGVQSWRWQFWYRGQWRSELPSREDNPRAAALELVFADSERRVSARFTLPEHAL